MPETTTLREHSHTRLIEAANRLAKIDKEQQASQTALGLWQITHTETKERELQSQKTTALIVGRCCTERCLDSISCLDVLLFHFCLHSAWPITLL